MKLTWNDKPFGSFAKGYRNKYHITPEGRRFYLEVNGVTQCQGTKRICKAFAQDVEDKDILEIREAESCH